MKDFPVITLCGSMRFFEAMLTIARDLTAKGFIVLAPFVIAETPELKTMLDAMHRCKIDKSSAIYIVDIDGYTGPSTKQEIAYALAKGKAVYYHSEEREQGSLCQK